MDYKTRAIIRGVCTLILLLNSILTAKGINPLPFDEDMFTEFLTYLISGLMALWAWWKDAPITKLAIRKYIEFDAEKVLKNGNGKHSSKKGH